MSTLSAAFVPGLIAGVISICTSFILMGGIFHRFKKETPATWRPEGPLSYALASLLHVVAAIGIACLATLMIRFHVGMFFEGLFRHLLLGLCLWGAVALPMFVESSLFVRIHPWLTVGRLLDWLITTLLTCAVTGWWLQE